MRTTHTKQTDYPSMLRLAKSNIGSRAIDVIDAFAKKKGVVSHRAGKVFWALVDEGQIVCTYVNGIAWVSAANAEHDNNRSKDIPHR